MYISSSIQDKIRWMVFNEKQVQFNKSMIAFDEIPHQYQFLPLQGGSHSWRNISRHCCLMFSNLHLCICEAFWNHDDVIKWEHFPPYWPFVRGIHRSPVNSQHKGQWRGALMFSLVCAWIYDWVNNSEAGDLRPSHPLWRHCNDKFHTKLAWHRCH